jgi:hypothetical protein
MWQDITLFGKKVLVGIALIMMPLIILIGGLRLTQHVLTSGSHKQQPASQTK